MYKRQVLDTYNHINGTGYIMLPKDYYTLPETITVNADVAFHTQHLKELIEEFLRSNEIFVMVGSLHPQRVLRLSPCAFADKGRTPAPAGHLGG